jgi:cold shock protein
MKEGKLLMKTETQTGTIFSLIATKGYGFIKRNSDGKTIFFHASRVVSPEYADLHEGDKVEFLELETPKGTSATDVVVIE